MKKWHWFALDVDADEIAQGDVETETYTKAIVKALEALSVYIAKTPADDDQIYLSRIEIYVHGKEA